MANFQYSNEIDKILLQEFADAFYNFYFGPIPWPPHSWLPTPNKKDEPKKFIKCSMAGHDIILTEEFINSVPPESKQKMDLPCGCKKVNADEIKKRIKEAKPYKN